MKKVIFAILTLSLVWSQKIVLAGEENPGSEAMIGTHLFLMFGWLLSGVACISFLIAAIRSEQRKKKYINYAWAAIVAALIVLLSKVYPS